MKHTPVIAAVLGFCMAVAFVESSAQMTREEVKADRDAFMKSHEWDGQTETWVAKPGAPKEAMGSTESRAQAKKERDAFLAKNKYSDECACYKPIGGAPRDMSTLTKEERKAEIADFNRTHEFNEGTATWVERKPK
jgi:hypothetical protein